MSLDVLELHCDNREGILSNSILLISQLDCNGYYIEKISCRSGNSIWSDDNSFGSHKGIGNSLVRKCTFCQWTLQEFRIKKFMYASLVKLNERKIEERMTGKKV